MSPLERTRATFKEISGVLSSRHIIYREEPRIREQEWGHLRSAEDSVRINSERDEYGPFYYRIPDGESAADVYDRVSDFFGTLHRDFSKADYPENAVIVAHGMTVRLFLMRWFHWTVEDFNVLDNPENCQVITLEKKSNDRYELVTALEKKKTSDIKDEPVKLMPHY